MTTTTKRKRVINERIEQGKFYDCTEALTLLKELPLCRFDQTIEACFNLGVDVRKSDQVIRGATVLPNGTGRSVRVAVFAQGEQADAANKAGAEVVGLEDLATSVKQGDINFDVVIATPDAMKVVGQLGQVLGPRGLMPNPKVGTVTSNVAAAIKNIKAGQVSFRTDKNGIVHTVIGKLSFSADQLKQNLEAVLSELKKLKPASAKGVYIKKVTISSTMGPGLAIEQSSLAH